MRLVGTDDRVLKVFAITGLDKVFEIHPTLDAALAASQGGVRATRRGVLNDTPVADEALVALLRADLAAARFTVDGVAERLGPVASAALHREQPLPALLATDPSAPAPEPSGSAPESSESVFDRRLRHPRAPLHPWSPGPRVGPGRCPAVARRRTGRCACASCAAREAELVSAPSAGPPPTAPSWRRATCAPTATTP